MKFQSCFPVRGLAGHSARPVYSCFGRLSLIVIAAAVVLFALPSSRADRAVAVAIKDAEIVTLAGKTIEKGSVVCRGGLIESVGENVTIPADARVIDGKGLTVYPGLIDGSTSLGLAAAPATPPPGRFGGGPSAAQAQQQAPTSSGLEPELEIADQIKPGGTAIETERSLGITTAVTTGTVGMFTGKSALINLAGDRIERMIVKSPLALHVQFQTSRTGGYPDSLMGVMAYLRQMMLDAQHYKAEWANFNSHKRGTSRPAPDKSLEALQPVIKGEMPVIFHVNSVNDIKRAVGLGEEFKLKCVISGGLQARKLATWLKEKHVPVLLSVNYPKRRPDADPDADEPLRALLDRQDAPKGAGTLAKAGVKFGFTSGGMQNISDFIPNVRKVVESGLSEEAAVRALTLGTAEILGVSEQLGSVEAGKIANLVVTQGKLLAKDAKVKYVFIDGEEVELKKPETPPAGAPAGARLSVGGRWELTVNSPGGQVVVTVTLTQSGQDVTGTATSQFGTAEISGGSVSGNRVKFTITFDAGGQQISAVFSAAVEGETMTGTVDAGAMGSMDFSGRKIP